MGESISLRKITPAYVSQLNQYTYDTGAKSLRLSMSDLPFKINITPGSPAYEQVIQAVHRALASGMIQANDPFPSVRALKWPQEAEPESY